jgi:uncharacterized protein (DUF2249 family)
MIGSVDQNERIISVKDIDPRHRHMVIQQMFENLSPGSSLQLVVDHEPKPLRFQLEAKYGGGCQWSYLEEGPDTWRVQLQMRTDAGS